MATSHTSSRQSQPDHPQESGAMAHSAGPQPHTHTQAAAAAAQLLVERLHRHWPRMEEEEKEKEKEEEKKKKMAIVKFTETYAPAGIKEVMDNGITKAIDVPLSSAPGAVLWQLPDERTSDGRTVKVEEAWLRYVPTRREGKKASTTTFATVRPNANASLQLQQVADLGVEPGVTLIVTVKEDGKEDKEEEFKFLYAFNKEHLADSQFDDHLRKVYRCDDCGEWVAYNQKHNTKCKAKRQASQPTSQGSRRMGSGGAAALSFPPLFPPAHPPPFFPPGRPPNAPATQPVRLGQPPQMSAVGPGRVPYAALEQGCASSAVGGAAAELSSDNHTSRLPASESRVAAPAAATGDSTGMALMGQPPAQEEINTVPGAAMLATTLETLEYLQALSAALLTQQEAVRLKYWLDALCADASQSNAVRCLASGIIGRLLCGISATGPSHAADPLLQRLPGPHSSSGGAAAAGPCSPTNPFAPPPVSSSWPPGYPPAAKRPSFFPPGPPSHAPGRPLQMPLSTPSLPPEGVVGQGLGQGTPGGVDEQALPAAAVTGGGAARRHGPHFPATGPSHSLSPLLRSGGGAAALSLPPSFPPAHRPPFFPRGSPSHALGRPAATQPVRSGQSPRMSAGRSGRVPYAALEQGCASSAVGDATSDNQTSRLPGSEPRVAAPAAATGDSTGMALMGQPPAQEEINTVPASKPLAIAPAPAAAAAAGTDVTLSDPLLQE
ncbi:unnamed protein product [Vitrella brassicaformis CCMP3155]|uniref:Uncharacterized protein n=1 Tax=Vitrella brassicaformis (strain CCMP3155) TaxID=1169540 RepID=A0A0G4ER70_VITBC|nr:unnamed protein product [Vitrella brassicaformis CCMP3155]|eukprot:CEM00303.1 unnamed protein product [Vitrella brassicaformis CCMP3155]